MSPVRYFSTRKAARECSHKFPGWFVRITYDTRGWAVWGREKCYPWVCDWRFLREDGRFS